MIDPLQLQTIMHIFQDYPLMSNSATNMKNNMFKESFQNIFLFFIVFCSFWHPRVEKKEQKIRRSKTKTKTAPLMQRGHDYSCW